jgi:hypothetical protein
MKNRISFLISIVFIFSASTSAYADPVDISGIWEDEPQQHFNQGTFSWGKNVYSTGSIIIDLGTKKPCLKNQGGVFFITKINRKTNSVELIGNYAGESETKKIIVHIIDKNTISIDLIDYPRIWLTISSENVFHRIPVNAPLEPLGPMGL